MGGTNAGLFSSENVKIKHKDFFFKVGEVLKSYAIPGGNSSTFLVEVVWLGESLFTI